MTQVPPRRRVASRRGRRPTSPPAGGPPRVLIVGVAVAAVAALLLFLVLRGDGEDGTAAPTDGADASKSAPTADPKEAWREELAALAPGDLDARRRLARRADELGLSDEARRLRREILLLDPDDADARRALGFERYEGPVTHLRGRWLDEDERRRVRPIEKLYSEDVAGAQTGLDVFLRRAREKVESMRDEYPEERWEAFYGPGRMRMPFVVFVEKAPRADVEALRAEYEELLTTLYDAFFDRYRERFQLEDIEQPVVVIIFDSVETYKDHIRRFPDRGYNDPAFIGGYYQPSEQRLIFWRQPLLRNVLLHEGAHMLIHYAFSGRGFVEANESPWFQEGFAEFFGGCKVVIENGKRRYLLGQRLPHREAELAFLEQSGQRLPVLDLVKVDHFRFNEAKTKQADASLPIEERQRAQALVSNIYAEGWALIMYLNWADGGKYRDVFDAYFEAEVKGAGHWGTLGELLGLETEDDWAEFDRRFLKWTQVGLKKL